MPRLIVPYQQVPRGALHSPPLGVLVLPEPVAAVLTPVVVACIHPDPEPGQGRHLLSVPVAVQDSLLPCVAVRVALAVLAATTVPLELALGRW